MKKIVTIVIPAYNEEKYIGNTIAAALRQTYSNIRVLVVDNNSTDTTTDIVKEFIAFDDRVRLVHEPRQGLIPTRQRGLEAVTTEFFAQLDADCIPPKNWILYAMRYFDDKKVNAVTGPYNYYDGTWYIRIPSLIIQILFFGITSVVIQLCKRGAVLMGGNTVIRTEALRNAGGYNLDLSFYAEDSDTGARLAQSGRVLYRTNLLMRTSARRFKDIGFWVVMKKYQKAFRSVVRKKQLLLADTAEHVHPR